MLVKEEDLQTSPLNVMLGLPVRIYLRENAQPFALHTLWLIPLTFRDSVNGELDFMVGQGVITPFDNNRSLWCHFLVQWFLTFFGCDPKLSNNVSS